MRLHIIIILCISLILLGVRFFFFYASVPIYKNGQTVSFAGVIQNQPKVVGNSQKLTISSSGNTFFITTTRVPAYWYGEKLTVHGVLRIHVTNGHQFISVSYPDVAVTPQQDSIAKFSEYIREKVSDTYAASLGTDMKGLLIGMVFGVQQNMSPNFLQALRVSGVMHVIAASGMNITFIAGGLLLFFQKMTNRRISLAMTLFGIVGYAALAGFQPSIDRAAIMGSFVLLAGIFGRQSFGLLALGLSAYGMLFVNPSWLFDIGFQLSFAATAGLFFIKPYIDVLFTRVIHNENILLADLSTTSAAQIATLPILVVNFGYYNPLSILINLLVLWTVPFIMLIGVLSAILTFVFVPAAQGIVWVVYPLLWYFKGVVMFAGTIPTVWQTTTFPITISIGYYLILIGVVMLARRKMNFGNQSGS